MNRKTLQALFEDLQNRVQRLEEEKAASQSPESTSRRQQLKSKHARQQQKKDLKTPTRATIRKEKKQRTTPTPSKGPRKKAPTTTYRAQQPTKINRSTPNKIPMAQKKRIVEVVNSKMPKPMERRALSLALDAVRIHGLKAGDEENYNHLASHILDHFAAEYEEGDASWHCFVGMFGCTYSHNTNRTLDFTIDGFCFLLFQTQ